MSQVVQAKCPHCKNVLRIPADWLSRSMRCKFCKKTFQAQARNSATASTNVSAAAPAPAAKAVAKPIKPPDVVPPAAAVVVAPPVPASDDPFGFPDEEAATTPAASPKRRKKGRGGLVLVLLFFFLFALGATGAGLVVYKVVSNPSGWGDFNPLSKNDGPGESKFTPDERKSDNATPQDGPSKKSSLPLKKDLGKTKKDGGSRNPTPFTNDPFPRRALLISVNNYLFYNPIHYGTPQATIAGGYPGSSTSVLRERLTRPPMNFPFNQVIELSDGIPKDIRTAKAHPTQKSVIETTIKDFVDSCRDQDRIVLVFAGHATSVEDKAYLIPIDGDTKETESLIPLKWVFDQLTKCKAQQKVLVLDVFRYSPSRGFKLQSAGEGDEGTMPEAFDKDLQNPPPGVQVWCSCQKDQSAIELDEGSAFFQALCYATSKLAGISSPSDPIPVEALVVAVNQKLKELLVPEKKTQISRLTGKAMEGAVALNSKEPLPPQLTIKPPTAQGAEAAKFADVNSMLEELNKLPPVREGDASEAFRAENLPAFSAKKLESYTADGYKKLAELQKKYKDGKDTFAKEFPLRAAYFTALEKLEESSKLRLREVLPSPIDPKRKAQFREEQEPMGQSIFFLDRIVEEMKAAAEQREKETSKRWQANFDFAFARVQSRLTYLIEYNYIVGQIRADNLPELAPGQTGWRVGTGKKIAVTESKAKALVKDTAKLWKRVQEEYPGTPWALLARRESMISLGLQWRPKSD